MPRFLAILAIFTIFASAAQPIEAAQCDATQESRDPVVNQVWIIPAGHWRVLNGWTNQPDSFQGERKLLLNPDQYVEVLMGGTLFSWPPQCERQAVDGYFRNSLPEVTAEQLGLQEWLCCGAEYLVPIWQAYMGQVSSPPASPPAPALPPTPVPPVVSGSAPVQGCPPAFEQTVQNPSDVALRGPAIVHPWWNNGRPDFGQTQIRVKVNRGITTTFFSMMGKIWSYSDTDACQANLDREFGNAPNLPIKNLDDLRRLGLVQ